MSKTKQRSLNQNAALHLLFQQISIDLNDAGLDVMTTLKHDAEIPWNAGRVKELMWKPLQEAVLRTRSTTRLSKTDVDDVYNVLNRYLGERFGIHVPFPSIESMNANRKQGNQV